MSNRDRFVFGLALAGLVIVPGLSAAVIDWLGYPTLGTITWVLGYGSGVITVWYVWIRPLDLRPPTASSPEESEREQ